MMVKCSGDYKDSICECMSPETGGGGGKEITRRQWVGKCLEKT